MTGFPLQVRGGTTAENNAFTGLAREPTVDTQKKRFRLHDGATAGGMEIPNMADLVGMAPNWAGVAGGTATDLAVSLSPAPAALVAGLSFRFITGAAASGAPPTLQVNALTAKAIVRWDGSVPTAGELPGGTLQEVVYDGTSFRLVPPSAGLACLRRQVVTAAANLDFALPANFTDLELRWSGVKASASGAQMGLQTSTNAGVSFAAGGADYFDFATYSDSTPAAPQVAVNGATSYALLSIGLPNSAGARNTGRASIDPAATGEYPLIAATARGRTAAGAALLMEGVSVRQATGAINAVRVLMNSGTITGEFALYGTRK